MLEPMGFLIDTYLFHNTCVLGVSKFFLKNQMNMESVVWSRLENLFTAGLSVSKV